jgi:hypothetical protein
MREMKSVRKSTRQANDDVKATLEKKHDREVAQAKVAKIKDKDLFKVNVSKDGLSQKRSKLAKDRFKQKDQKGTSLVEKELIKRI